jgi:NADH:ubiquinone oxidoreductase subunit 5 (subunit L)/multisubunit Na+/H+ antiporter MnhA subunit
MNRIGDLALIVSFLMLYEKTGSFSYSNIFLMAEYLNSLYINLIFIDLKILDLLMFLISLGCIAKSAQIGLHT